MNDTEKLFKKRDIRKLKKLLKKFVNKINKSIKIELETQFVCSVTEKKVFVGLLPLLEDFKENEVLKEIYREKGFNYHDLHIFALLHEIGHIESVKDMNDIELNINLQIYQLQVKGLQETCLNDRHFMENYIDLPLEERANKWALNYIEKNPKKVEKFTKKFYKKFDRMVDKTLGA